MNYYGLGVAVGIPIALIILVIALIDINKRYPKK